MKSSSSLFGILFVIFLTISCKSEYQFTINAPKKLQLNQELTVSLSEKNNNQIDSVQFNFGSKQVMSTNGTIKLPVEGVRLGKHTVTAIAFYENKSKKIEHTVYVLADTAPKVYSFKVLNTYPHDAGAYTQGLEYHNGFLYEGTGQNGRSSIRKVEIETGKVLQKVELAQEYFGEGITIFNDKLIQLTWRSGKGFIYNLNTFEKEGEFDYTKSREGWGLTNDGERLIKSEGTERIWFLDPETKVEKSYIEAYTNQRKVESLNELEYINGKIYANIWKQNSILIVDPISGKVDAVVNLNALKDLILQEQNLTDEDEVLNGIAFDKEGNRLFVTGKHWAKLYEIELIK